MKSSKKQEVAAEPEVPMGFIVRVDGKTYGPFPEKEKKRFSYLRHKKGVEFKPVPLLSLSLSRKAEKEEHPSLLDGIEFTPVSKTSATKTRR